MGRKRHSDATSTDSVESTLPITIPASAFIPAGDYHYSETNSLAPTIIITPPKTPDEPQQEVGTDANFLIPDPLQLLRRQGGLTHYPITATHWRPVYEQRTYKDVQVRHGVERPVQPRLVEGERGAVRLYERLRRKDLDCWMDFDFCGPDTRPGKRYVSCRGSSNSFLNQVHNGSGTVQEVFDGKRKNRTKLARWSMKKCLQACMKHNARYECSCSVARLAGRKRQTVPVYELVDGVERKSNGFEMPVGLAHERHGANDSVGFDMTRPRPPSTPSASPSRVQFLHQVCCDAGSTKAEMMAILHSMACDCRGLGERVECGFLRR
ncbi:hypothetical protein ANO11243_086430 [Dothideomycetidae sp. 11243]|nr:hypothetical protein ANO11243_086430 [fungal sp. No.11243]